jgi:hypothetical protein
MTKRTRDPYERAFNAAVKRRERAVLEKAKTEEKLRALNEEIPRLEGIISVLSGEPTSTPVIAEQQFPSETPLRHPGLPGGIPAHLQRYLKPIISRTAPLPVLQIETAPIDDDLPNIPGEPVLE